jgi:hypothetical protein
MFKQYMFKINSDKMLKNVSYDINKLNYGS